MAEVERRFHMFYSQDRFGPLTIGVRIDARGLRLVNLFGCGRRLCRWDEVRDVVVDDSGLTLHKVRGEVRLDANLRDFPHLASQCRRAIGREAVEEAPREDRADVAAEEVARWLGVSGDGVLECASSVFRGIEPFVRFILVPFLLCIPFLAIQILLSGRGWQAFFAGLMPGLIPILAWRFLSVNSRGRRTSKVRATPTTLAVRTDAGWRQHAWGSFENLFQVGGLWVATTVDGDVWLPKDLTHLDTLLAAIRKAIDARRDGFALPRMGADVPDAALSRAASAEVTVERGLSRADEGAEG